MLRLFYYISSINYLKLINKNRQLLFFFSFSFLVQLMWLLAFYPGFMSVDSISQWDQAYTFQLNDWHPYLSTLYIWLFQRIFGNPASVSVFQIFSTTLFFSWMFDLFLKKGIKKFIIIPLFIIFSISIPIGVYNITLWKDIPFSLSIVMFGFFLSQTLNKESWCKLDYLLFTALSVLTIYMRHNGIVFLLITPVIIFLFSRKKLISTTLILIFVYLFFSFVVPKILEVKPKQFYLSRISILHAEVGLYNNQPWTNLSKETTDLLEDLGSKSELNSIYNPVCADYIFSGDINPELINSKEYWDKLTVRFVSEDIVNNISFYLGDRFNMFVSTLLGSRMIYIPEIADNTNDIRFSPVSNSLNSIAVKILDDINGNPVLFFMVWNNLIPLVVLMFALLDSCYKKNIPLIIFSLFILCQLPFIFFLSTCADWRYLYFCYLAGFIAIPMYFVKPDKLRKT